MRWIALRGSFNGRRDYFAILGRSEERCVSAFTFASDDDKMLPLHGAGVPFLAALLPTCSLASPLVHAVLGMHRARCIEGSKA